MNKLFKTTVLLSLLSLPTAASPAHLNKANQARMASTGSTGNTSSPASTTNTASDDFTNRVGIGVNWAGFQAKVGVAPSWMAEGKMQFASNNTILGTRLYHYFPELPRMIFPTHPYWGVEADWVFSEFLRGGVLGGSYVGIELMPTPHIGLGCDVGLYYTNLWSSMGSVTDLGAIVNLGVIFYF
jgi:hypothetical protein